MARTELRHKPKVHPDPDRQPKPPRRSREQLPPRGPGGDLEGVQATAEQLAPLTPVAGELAELTTEDE